MKEVGMKYRSMSYYYLLHFVVVGLGGGEMRLIVGLLNYIERVGSAG
jgi:hypothetical protein